MQGKFRRFAALCCLWAALLSACLPVSAQFNPRDVMSFSDAMSGRVFPLTLKLSDLAAAPDTWRQFSLSAGGAAAPYGGVTDTVYQAAIGPYLLYFTEGKTFVSGQQTFVVAYHAALSRADLDRVFRDADGMAGQKNGEVRLPASTSLSLSLLSMATIGNINNVARFDPSLVAPALTPAQQQANQADSQSAASLSNLKQISLGLLQYTQDYDEMYPPMNSATGAQIQEWQKQKKEGTYVYKDARYVQERLAPYVKNDQLFLQPGTNKSYQTNGSLSRRNLASIENTNTTVAFYEATPDAAGKRAIAFADGHVQRINEKDWPQLRRASLVTVRLTGAAALYYAYRKRQNAPMSGGLSGRLFISRSTERVYVRYPDGHFQWLAPPANPIEVPYETGQYLGLGKYQGYNSSTQGKTFGGYGASSTPNYPNSVAVTL